MRSAHCAYGVTVAQIAYAIRFQVKPVAKLSCASTLHVVGDGQLRSIATAV